MIETYLLAKVWSQKEELSSFFLIRFPLVWLERTAVKFNTYRIANFHPSQVFLNYQIYFLTVRHCLSKSKQHTETYDINNFKTISRWQRNQSMTRSDKTVTLTVYRPKIFVVVTYWWTIPSHHRDCGRKSYRPVLSSMPKWCVLTAMLPGCVSGGVWCGGMVELLGAVDVHRTMVHSGSAIILGLCYCCYRDLLPRCWRSNYNGLLDSF